MMNNASAKSSTLFFTVSEITAMVLSATYTWLYLKGVVPGCFIPAFIGSSIYVALCWKKKIYAESFLYLFYVGMAVVGYFSLMPEVMAASWTISTHLLVISAGAAATVISGFLLRRHSDAATPYLDSFTTIFSLIATWMMVAFIHENWLYWIVIDTLAIFLYAKRRMWITVLLFVLYLLMAIDGYFEALSLF
ncbi:MAG: nicotinamide riboside transporter PnuC [Flavobacteriales bacterium]|jgi:nicotinamide mononucleotide transporter|nr:nicotinamide riboside transporter PnuC [Flavobacteriales bacterium]